ncbi:hypothetical protein JCM3765_005012 [Sporobolomyces pararoseus]
MSSNSTNPEQLPSISNQTTSFPPRASSAAPPPSPPPASGNGSIPPALAVRLGVMRRIFLALTGMDQTRRWRLSFTTFIGAGQVIAFIVILALYYNKPCDQNLGLYLILLIVRISLAFPTALWSAISPRHNRRDTPERREELERNRLVGNNRIDRRVKKVSDLVSLYGLIIFLVGNIWIISSDTCSATNPVLYKAALAGLILSWIWILEFFILCAVAIFFLPILLYGIRHWGWGEKKHEVGPLKKNDISKLPRRIFVGILPEDATVTHTSDPSPSTLSPPETKAAVTPEPSKLGDGNGSKKSRRQLWRLYRSTRTSSPSSLSDSQSPTPSSSIPISDFPPFPPKTLPIQLPESQNACSICLAEYEVPPARSSPDAAKWEPEILLLLPCHHAFHESCLSDWLAVSGRCALCQTPVFPQPAKTDKTPPSTSNPVPPPSTSTTDSTTPTNDASTSTNDRSTQTVPSGEEDRNRVENLA